MMIVSRTSWLLWQKNSSQPVSLWATESMWSTHTLQGGAMARLTFVITIGSLAPEAHMSTSCMSVSPWELVAVYVLAPAVWAAMHAAIALCSLSTGMNFAFSSPVVTNSASFSTMDVCGVVG